MVGGGADGGGVVRGAGGVAGGNGRWATISHDVNVVWAGAVRRGLSEEGGETAESGRGIGGGREGEKGGRWGGGQKVEDGGSGFSCVGGSAAEMTRMLPCKTVGLTREEGGHEGGELRIEHGV
jgi:hypothetical protein